MEPDDEHAGDLATDAPEPGLAAPCSVPWTLAPSARELAELAASAEAESEVADGV